MAADRFGIVGKVVARTYEVEDFVAEGGFGVVYRAYHRGFRAKVALKCLKIPDDLTEEQRRKFLEQFRSEAEVLFRLSSQISNIVRPLHVDSFQSDTGQLVPFMALEWLDGRTLDAIILRRAERGRPPIALESLVRLLTPVASALEQAHHLKGADGAMTVVHRDMKPENLFIAKLGNDDVAKILDFGISKVKSAAGQLAGKASQTGDAFVAFSPAYAAPEQWAPRRFGQTGRWTDVWGLAITVVEAVKGAEVISGDHAAMMGTIIDPARRPTPRNEGVRVSDGVERVFTRALAVDPRDRYQTVGEFWDDLVREMGLGRDVAPVSLRSAEQGASRGDSRSTTDRFDSVFPAPASGPAYGKPPPSVGGGVPSGVRLLDPLDENSSVKIPKAPSLPGVGVQTPPGRPPARSNPGGRAPLASGLELETVSARPGPARYASYRAPGPTLTRALSPAIALIILSIAVTALDRVYADTRGVPLSLGPLRASYVAGLIMVLALYNGFVAVRRHLSE